MAAKILSPNPQILCSFSLLSELSYRSVRQPQSWLRKATKPKRWVVVGVSIQEPQTLFLLADSAVGYSLVAHQMFGEIQDSAEDIYGRRGSKKAPNQSCGRDLIFLHSNNFIVTDRRETIIGAYFCKRASRKEQIKVKLMVAEDGTRSDIVVQGHEQQVDQMRKELQLSEKGIIYVKVSPRDDTDG